MSEQERAQVIDQIFRSIHRKVINAHLLWKKHMPNKTTEYTMDNFEESYKIFTKISYKEKAKPFYNLTDEELMALVLSGKNE